MKKADGWLSIFSPELDCFPFLSRRALIES